MVDPNKWARIRAGIFAGESQGDYDALFSFSNRPKGPFENTKLRNMTVDQALEFSDPSGQYGQWVKGQIGRVATPMGAYQIVGSTLRDAKDGLGLTGNERMDEGLQEKLGQWIYGKQGTGAWEGYKGEQDVAPMVEERDMNGNLTTDFLKRMAGGAINRATDGPMTNYQGPMSQAMNEGSDPNSVMNFMDPSGGQASPAYDNSGLLGKLLPDRSDVDRRKMLLAIGSGILSGDDWATGIGQAGKNVLGLTMDQEKRQQDLEDNNIAFDRQKQLLEYKSKLGPAGGIEYKRVGSVVDPATNEVIGGVSYDSQTGNYFTQNPDGTQRVIRGAVPLNNSTAAGDKLMTAGEMGKQQNTIKESQSGLRAMDRIIGGLDDVNYGAAGFVDDMKLNLKTLFGSNNMTDEELQRRVMQGELQGLIGKARTDVVGGGVMTEQDAARVALALGGDFSSIFQNPEVAKQLLTTRRSSMLQDLNLTHDQYDAGRAIPGSPWIEIPRYGQEATLDSSKADSGPSTTPALSTPKPPKSFEGTPEEWAVMDPEDQAMWAEEDKPVSKGSLSLSSVAQEAMAYGGFTASEWDQLGPAGQKDLIQAYLQSK